MKSTSSTVGLLQWRDPAGITIKRHLLTAPAESPSYGTSSGDISFVSPRPERPFFVEHLEKEIPGYRLRHYLPPGITGLAQVEGKYSTPPEDKLRYDLMYGKTASPLVDLRILLRTLSVLMLRDKAS
ncbi:sugar transferase [Moorellaceae bacterium AZ2]